MTKRRRPIQNGNGSVFNAGTAINVLSIPLLTGAIILIGFYFITRDELSRHDVAITETIPKQFKSEADAREKSRAEFLDKLDKLNTGVSSLNTNVAVQTQALQALKESLTSRR